MSDFRIKTCVLGMVSTDCYIVYHQGQAVIIDPADNGSYIWNQCRELGVTPVAILLTHGHFDHVMAAEELRKNLGIHIYAGEAEAALLKDPSLNLSTSFGTNVSFQADRLVKDGDVLEFLGAKWQVLETPGHTTGSVCYLVEEEDLLFSGDTLFAESLGRTDFPTGNSGQIIKSITERLFELREDIMVYPGHGEPTTIGHEKRYNPVAHYRR